MPTAEPSAERVSAALDEILGWQGIIRSPQLAELLRYVVEKTLAGDGSSIKAYSIAVDVFGRPQSFDPQADPIVRVQARRLRNLLEQFYQSGESRADVEIHLPLGRYVPEFREVAGAQETGTAAAAASGNAAAPVAGARNQRLPRFLLNALLGLCFTIISVTLAVVIVRWTTPPPTVPVPQVLPEMPALVVGGFDNLTGQPVLDDDVVLFSRKVADLLGRFDDIRVADAGEALQTLSGTVQQVDGRYVIRALLRAADGTGSIWSGTVTAPTGLTDTEALEQASEWLAGQLANATGPLHAPGRGWLKLQATRPEPPTIYVCDLMFMTWRSSRALVDAQGAYDCLSDVLAREPTNALALAAIAGIGSWRGQVLTATDADRALAMAEMTSAATRAVAFAPLSSFAHEQQGLVLGRRGDVVGALRAVQRARDLNPASMDALALHGGLLWLSGDMETGVAEVEEALAAIASPPPWYYTTRALHALQQQRYFDAIDAAQALSGSDNELGPAIALAAAPRAGRQDLIDRYRPLVLNNPRFQATGIVTRLGLLVRANPIVAKIREGMVLAGIPANALDGPFNADGSPRTTPER